MDSHRGQPFGEYLRAELERRDMTAYQLAEKTGISQTVLSRWVRGASAPTIDNLRPVAEKLRLPLLELVVRAGLLTEEEAAAKPSLDGAGPAPQPVTVAADALSNDELLAEVSRRMRAPAVMRPPTREEIAANPERFVVVDPGKKDHREPGKGRRRPS